MPPSCRAVEAAVRRTQVRLRPVATTILLRRPLPHNSSNATSSYSARCGAMLSSESTMLSRSRKGRIRQHRAYYAPADWTTTTTPDSTIMPHRYFHSTKFDNGRKNHAAAASSTTLPNWADNSSLTTEEEDSDADSEIQKKRKRRFRAATFKAKLLLENWKNGQAELKECFQDYYASVLLGSTAEPTTSTQVMDGASVPFSMAELNSFSHPSPADVTWQQMVQSEEAFAKLCSACDESLVDLGSIFRLTQDNYDDDDNDGNDGDNVENDANDESNASAGKHVPYILKLPNGPALPSRHNKIDQEIMEHFKDILFFWERIRKERTFIVQALQPVGYPNVEPNETPKTENTIPTTTWGIGALLRFLPGGYSGDEVADGGNTSTKSIPIVQAHASLEHAPSQIQYTTLMGRMFYSFPRQNLAPSDWYSQRAKQMQDVVDQAPTVEVLSKKSILLLVRAYWDVGTLAGCKQAEELYHRYPFARQNVIAYVLHGYWKLTKQQTDENVASKTHAGIATVQVMKLLLTDRSDVRRRNHLFPFAYQCLLNTSPESVNGYYGYIEELARRKFGLQQWEQMVSPRIHGRRFELKARDIPTVHYLIQLFGRPPSSDSNYINETLVDENFERAMRLLDLLCKGFVVGELQDTFHRSTFHMLLGNMVHRRKRRQRSRQETQQDFEDAMTILRCMVSCKAWWPNGNTWDMICFLAHDGPQMDEVWRKHELWTAMKGETGLRLLSMTHCALNSWARTARYIKQSSTSTEAEGNTTNNNMDSLNEEFLPSQRAWQLFQSLRNYSSPYFFAKDPSLVRHLYNPDDAPDEAVYSKIWRICSIVGDWNTARKVYEVAQEEQSVNGRELYFKASTYTAFLNCLIHCPDQDLRYSLAEQVYEEALKTGHTSVSMQSALELVHPELYARLKSDNDDEDGDSEDTDESD